MPTAASPRWLSIVGIGEDGADGLSPVAQKLIAAAELVVGGKRHLALADGLIRAGRHEEALDEAQTACRRDGRFFLPRIVAAWSLVKLARPHEARAMLSEAKRIRPSLDREQVERFFGRRAAAELDAAWG